MDTLNISLKNLGFTPKEVEIYTSLLELGEASYTDLAKKTGIKRTSLYAMVSKLQERGVVQYHVDTRTLSPILPDEFFSNLQSHVLQFHKLIPQLKALGKQNRAISKVKFYSGVEGIKQAYMEADTIITPPKKDRWRYVIGDMTTWVRFWRDNDPAFLPKYLKHAAETGYRCKSLWSGKTEEPYDDTGSAPQYKIEAKMLPENYQHRFDMEIRPNDIKITDLTSEQPYTIKIVSTELAQALMSFFEFAWEIYGKDK